MWQRSQVPSFVTDAPTDTTTPALSNTQTRAEISVNVCLEACHYFYPSFPSVCASFGEKVDGGTFNSDAQIGAAKTSLVPNGEWTRHAKFSVRTCC